MTEIVTSESDRNSDRNCHDSYSESDSGYVLSVAVVSDRDQRVVTVHDCQ